MEFNKKIIEILSFLYSLNNLEVNRYLDINNNSVFIKIEDDELVKINEDSIILGDKINFIDKFRVKDKSNSNNKEIDINNLKKFFSDIADSIIRLNHIGVSYYSDKIKNKISDLDKKIKETSFSLYYEESGIETQKWLFAGNKENWKAALFEIVLNDKSVKNDKWVPHFQIDIDTKYNFKELEEVCKKYNYKFSWVLDVDGFGKLLGMIVLGNVNGNKICLGLGSSNRGVEWHRKEVLEELINV